MFICSKTNSFAGNGINDFDVNLGPHFPDQNIKKIFPSQKHETISE